MKKIKIFLILVIIFLNTLSLQAQTSGKLAGLVTDADKNPLSGVNVVLEGQLLGASTDLDGNYVILNIRSGT